MVSWQKTQAGLDRLALRYFQERFDNLCARRKEIVRLAFQQEREKARDDEQGEMGGEDEGGAQQ